jgi:hypothetical protein
MTVSQSASLSWCQATIGARDQFFFFLEILLRLLRVYYCTAPSLTRGQVCNLLLWLQDNRYNFVVAERDLESSRKCKETKFY